MNYYIDLIPSENFIDKADLIINSKKENQNIIFNLYIKQLPSMCINKLLYIDIDQCSKIIQALKNKNYKINLMLDRFCFGNKEFTENGKNIFLMLDSILQFDIDYITVTNNFFFNYIKRRHKNCKIIISEYTEVNNIQKVCRYLDDIGADAVKLNTELYKNLDIMTYISKNFNLESIHIDTNKISYENDILKDSFNNSISHYIQEEKWDDIEKSLANYQNEQNLSNNKKIQITSEDILNLKQLGFYNFWHYCNIDEDKYLHNISDLMSI